MLRGDPAKDSKYENGQVSLETTDFTPSRVVAKVGEVITVRLNVRGQEGKLLKDLYNNPEKSIRVLGEEGDVYQISRGTDVGTYLI